MCDWKLDATQGNCFSNLAGKDLPAKVVGHYKIVDESTHPAIELTGEGYLEVAHDTRLDLTGGCTLDAWICPKQQPAAGGRILDKSAVGTSNGYLLDTHPGNSLRLITQRGVLSYDAKLQPDVWAHVAATVDAKGRLALYIDGQQVASKEPTLPGQIEIDARIARIRRFHQGLVSHGLFDSYEAAHARLVIEYLAATCQRFQMLSAGKLRPLPATSQLAADESYLNTTLKLCEGLEQTVLAYSESGDERERQLYRIWTETESSPE